jgi:sialate O-acetylesterase
MKRYAALISLLVLTVSASADIRLPAIIGSNMVLQRGRENPIWGWGEAGEKVTVTFAGQTLETTCDDKGTWRATLAPMEASAKPRTMVVAGKNTLTLENVLVGEVWVCSGQSNMGMSVSGCWNADLDRLGAKYPAIRLITNPNPGSQEPQTTFNGKWEACTPETVPGFSAVGYYFGRTLHQVLGVPVGLIDNAWGGSACEAWIRRDLLGGKEIYKPLMDRWTETEKTFDFEKAKAGYAKKLEEWKTRCSTARAEGKPLPNRPRPPQNRLTGQHRPANLFNARLLPIVPFGIRGAVWYQGESNSSRAYQYRDMFPLMIQNWRDVWGQGDFPFYWVQLADFRDEEPAPGGSNWAELREAQTMTMDRLPNAGQAVIIDLGEASDIHPKRKQEVGYRLARWALARDYGVDVPHRSAQYQSMAVEGRKAVITFDHVNGGLRTVDHRKISGFAIAGEDQEWVWADAKIRGKDRVEVWSDSVEKPVAVRYAWANNPACNLYDQKGLPVTPFRTDDWPGVTANAF